MDALPDHHPEAYQASPYETGLLEATSGRIPARATFQTREGVRADSNDPELPNDIRSQMAQVAGLESLGIKARQAGDEAGAGELFQSALAMALQTAEHPALGRASTTRIKILETATRLALQSGETDQAKQIMAEVVAADTTAVYAGEWIRFRDITAWPDAWLVAAIRREPPDMTALNTLVKRHWQALFSRCRMLTLHQMNADDLAQDVWRRVLKGRDRLAPGRNFIGYLLTIATNLWRDSLRSAKRAGPMAVTRLASLDAAVNHNEDDEVTLLEMLPDLKNSTQAEQRMVADDIDEAMAAMAPLIREVLVARYIDGESCVEIGKRHGRTEQTIRNWLRAAVAEIKQRLQPSPKQKD